MDSWDSASDRKTRGVSCEITDDVDCGLTDDGIVVREVADLVNVNVPAVSVVQLDDDVIVVGVGPGDGAGVEVSHLAAPVCADSLACSQHGHRGWPHVTNLRINKLVQSSHSSLLTLTALLRTSSLERM